VYQLHPVLLLLWLQSQVCDHQLKPLLLQVVTHLLPLLI
jgi:hypothetical protein